MTRATLSPLFRTITLRDWTPAIAHARSQPNAASAQIRERLSPLPVDSAAMTGGSSGIMSKPAGELCRATIPLAPISNSNFGAAIKQPDVAASPPRNGSASRRPAPKTF